MLSITFVDDIRLTRAATILEGRIAISKDLDTLEGWVMSNIMLTNKDRSKVLPWRLTEALQ